MYTHFQSGSRSRTMSSVSRSCGQSAWVLGRVGDREGAGRWGPGGEEEGKRQRRERGGEQRDTHIHTHRDMSSVTFSVLQSASLPHAPSRLWTCRSLPITNGVQCRQGWGARPVTGAENSWGKRERGVGGNGIGAQVGKEGCAPGRGGEGGVRGGGGRKERKKSGRTRKRMTEKKDR